MTSASDSALAAKLLAANVLTRARRRVRQACEELAALALSSEERIRVVTAMARDAVPAQAGSLEEVTPTGVEQLIARLESYGVDVVTFRASLDVKIGVAIGSDLSRDTDGVLLEMSRDGVSRDRLAAAGTKAGVFRGEDAKKSVRSRISTAQKPRKRRPQ